MNFGPNRYVPVLKIKRGEKAALDDLGTKHPGDFTPLLEVVSRKPDKTLAAHLDTSFDKLAKSVAKLTPCFLDTRELAVDGESASYDAFKRACVEGIQFIPVVGARFPRIGTSRFPELGPPDFHG